MSAQRAMSSAAGSGSIFRLIAALVLGIALGASGVLLLTAGPPTPRAAA